MNKFFPRFRDKSRVNKLLGYFTLIFFTLLFAMPFIWIILSSFKSGSELFSRPPSLWPRNFTLENYTMAFKEVNFLRYFFNSFIVATLATVITLFINSMAGYALAKFKFKGSKIIFFSLIFTIMIPLQVIMVPVFIVLRHLNLYDTLWGIIIPPTATPTGVFLIRQYMVTIPNELIESARIDGAGEWRIFWTIIIPLAKPVLTALMIFSFIWRWNDFIWPFIVISSEKRYTIQIALANFVGQYTVDWNAILSMTTLSTIPVFIVFLIFQRHFVKGIAMSGMKM